MRCAICDIEIPNDYCTFLFQHHPCGESRCQPLHDSTVPAKVTQNEALLVKLTRTLNLFGNNSKRLHDRLPIGP